MLAEGRWCDSDLNPYLFYGRLICAARGVNEKHPIFLHSFDTWKMAIIGRRSQGAQHSSKAGHYSIGIWDLEKNPPCNAEDKSTCWTHRHLKPGSGVTEGVPD